MNYWLFLIPIISAFIGWLANRLLIKMLFHPLKPKSLLGITIQGVFPKQQRELSERIGKLVSKEFFTSFDLEQKISDPANFEKIMPVIEEHIDDFLRNRLKNEMPMISMFIGDKTVNKLKAAFIKEIETIFPQVMKQFAGNLKNEPGVETVVKNKIATLSPVKIEQALYQNMGKELRLAGIFGALIGFIIGVVQVLIMIITT